MDKEYILVLDYGSQYNQLIVRRIRELNVYSKLVSHKIDFDILKNDKNLKGIILSGGPDSVYEKDAFDLDKKIFDLNIPILGICYGMQIISQKLGGKVEPGQIKEFGKTEIEVIDSNSILFKNTKEKQITWMSHMDKVVKIPSNFKKVAISKDTDYVAIEDIENKIYGIQFHLEVTHTEFGMQILKNFIDICNINDKWLIENIIDNIIEDIRIKVGNKKVLCALSGGVDSSVVAALLSKAIGNQLTCIFVNNGLLRKGEFEQVVNTFSNMNLNLIAKDAQDVFLNNLKGIVFPEEKRKIIGKTFIDIFESESKKLDDISFLAQGTIYPDVIESGTSTADTIKSHHNVGGIPENMQFELIEPLRNLFKDEVRKLGLLLDLPKEIVYRQPFPGPGLSIRIMGEVTKEKLNLLKNVDHILRREIEKDENHYGAWQYFAVLVGAKSVGVVGDKRRYGEVIAIRSVSSVDGMSADFSRIDFEVLSNISSKIINEVDDVSRVVYDITSKPPGTIEWE